MSVGLLGKKVGMTQVFNHEGAIVPVTIVEAGPCFVLQIKSDKKDGYFAVQLGFENKKESKTTKPLMGHFKKSEASPKRFINEFRILAEDKFNVGQKISVDIFKPGDFVDVRGTSKGKGFQGGMKRWNWKGGKATHGSMHHRAPGSIGASADPSRVLKGKNLPGRMGQDKKTTQHLEVIEVDKENNLLVIKGGVPGATNSLVIINKAKKKGPKKVKTDESSQKVKEKEGKKPGQDKENAKPQAKKS